MELVHQYIHIYIHSNSLCAETVFFFFLSTSVASFIFYRGEGGNSRRSSCRGIPSAAMASIGFAPNPYQIQPSTHSTRTARILQSKFKSNSTQTGTRQRRHARWSLSINIYIYIHSNSLCAETVFFLSTSLASSIFLQRRRRNQQKVQLQRHSKCSYGFHRFCTKPHQIQPNTHPTRTARVLQRKLKSKPTQTGTRRSRHAVGILLAVIYHYISGLSFLRVCLKVFGSVG